MVTLRTLIAVILVAVIPLAALADPLPLKFYTTIDPPSGTQNDEYIYSVVIEGTADTPYPFLTGGDDFTLTLIGPESSVSVINGRIYQKISYNYRLIPKKSGTLMTPAAELEVEGQTFNAPAIKVDVRESQGEPRGSEPVFLSQRVDRGEVYIGEQLVNSLELFASIALIQPELDSLSFDGFWQEQLGEDRNFRRYINGKPFDVLSIQKALFPLRSGELTIPKRQITTHIRQRSKGSLNLPFGSLDPFDRDLFDDIFGKTTYKELAIESEELSVRVKELPPAPAGFPDWELVVPLVGKTELELEVTAGDIDLGESKPLTLVVTSRGNLSPLKSLPVEQLRSAGLKVYQDPPTADRSVDGGRLLSKRSFKLSLVPIRAGTVNLPAFELGFFNPDNGRYETAKTQPYSFSVRGSAADASFVSTDEPEQQGDRSPAASPAPEPPSVSLEEPLLARLSARISPSMLAYVVVALLAASVLILAALDLRRRSAPVRRLAAEIEQAQNAADLHSVLAGLVRKNLSPSGQSSTDAVRALIERQVAEPGLRFELLDILDLLEGEMYGGGKTSSDLESLKSRALKSSKALVC